LNSMIYPQPMLVS